MYAHVFMSVGWDMERPGAPRYLPKRRGSPAGQLHAQSAWLAVPWETNEPEEHSHPEDDDGEHWSLDELVDEYLHRRGSGEGIRRGRQSSVE